MNKLVKGKKYEHLIKNIGILLEKSRENVYTYINQTLVKAYWEVGKEIIEFEQEGKEKADYGSKLLKILSKNLKIKHGKGFSRSNVYLMRQFYLKYAKFQTLSGKLSWSHYVELLGISEDIERSFYEKQCGVL